MLIQSAKLSPTVVHRILMTQNHTVISGTLFSIALRVSTASDLVVSVTKPEGRDTSLRPR
jgi:hypothetical protein